MRARKLLKPLLIVTFLLSQTAQAEYNAKPHMGVNVSSIEKFTSSLPFTDIFKMSKGWFTSCRYDWQTRRAIDPGCSQDRAFNTREQDLLELDQNGWVKRLPAPGEGKTYTSVVSSWHLSKRFPLGRYIVMYDGQGEINLTGDVQVVNQGNGQIAFDLRSVKRGLRLQITRTNPSDYIRNIRVIPQKFVNNYQQYPLNPDYVQRLRPFHVLRFMPWSNPRSNDASQWSDRARLSSAHYSGTRGVPLERMIDMANAADVTPWINVPYKANDDYIRNYAALVKARLRPNQNVYVEYSNEMWNVIFPGTTYAARKGDELWRHPYTNKNAYQRRVSIAMNWSAKRGVEMCRIFKAEFGSQAKRVKCVLAAQSSSWVGKEALDCPLWKESGGGCGRHMDAFAINPYFGDYIARQEHRAEVTQWTNDPDGGMGKLFQEILNGGVLQKGQPGGAMPAVAEKFVKENLALTRKYGLPLMAYESGQHLIRFDPPHKVENPRVLELFMNAQKDPRMGQAYDKFLKTWYGSGGGLLMHYYGIGEPTKKNFFGMLDYLHQPSTPKYASLMRQLGRDVDTYVPPAPTYTPPTAPAQAHIEYAQPQQQAGNAQSFVNAPAGLAAGEYVETQAAPTYNEYGDGPVYVEDHGMATNVQAQNHAPVSHSGQSFDAMPVAPAAPQQQMNMAEGVTGPAVSGWASNGLSARSPMMAISGPNMMVAWRFNGVNRNPSSSFEIYVIDESGRRSLALRQTAKDMAEVGNYDQMFEYQISGQAASVELVASPGLSVIVHEVRM